MFHSIRSVSSPLSVPLEPACLSSAASRVRASPPSPWPASTQTPSPSCSSAAPAGCPCWTSSSFSSSSLLSGGATMGGVCHVKPKTQRTSQHCTPHHTTCNYLEPPQPHPHHNINLDVSQISYCFGYDLWIYQRNEVVRIAPLFTKHTPHTQFKIPCVMRAASPHSDKTNQTLKREKSEFIKTVLICSCIHVLSAIQIQFCGAVFCSRWTWVTLHHKAVSGVCSV